MKEDVGKTYQSVAAVIDQLDSTIALLKAEAAKQQANHTAAGAEAAGGASATSRASDLASELGKALGAYGDAAPNATTGACRERAPGMQLHRLCAPKSMCC